MTPTPAEVNVGFGCLWNRSRDQTWSYTPSSLLAALTRTGPCVDLGYDARMRRQLSRIRHTRRRDGRFRSSWRYESSTLDAAAHAIGRAIDASRPDVVVTVPDIGVFGRPFFVYQDLSYDLVLKEVRSGNQAARANFRVLSMDDLERSAERQREVFRQSAGILAMSEWYARSLVEDSGLDRSFITVVRPGTTAATDQPLVPLDRRTPALLFVGRDFEGKGGDLLVEAVAALRAGGIDLALTIMGPRNRPPKLPQTAWINFVPEASPVDVAESMRSHIAFVLPTRFEGFGIVFQEALRAGTPCVGPDAFAVPEIITDGEDGALFSEWTAESVAEALVRATTDEVRERALALAPQRFERLSWNRAAGEVRAAAAEAIA